MNAPKACFAIGAADAASGAIARHSACEGDEGCVTRGPESALSSLLESIRNESGRAHGFGLVARRTDVAIDFIDRTGGYRLSDASRRVKPKRRSQARAPCGLGSVQPDAALGEV